MRMENHLRSSGGEAIASGSIGGMDLLLTQSFQIMMLFYSIILSSIAIEVCTHNHIQCIDLGDHWKEIWWNECVIALQLIK